MTGTNRLFNSFPVQNFTDTMATAPMLDFIRPFEPPSKSVPLVLARSACGATSWLFATGEDGGRHESGGCFYNVPYWLAHRRCLAYQRIEMLEDNTAACGPLLSCTGAMTWAAGEECARWVGACLAEEGLPHSALELGAGCGLVAIALALAGVRRVVSSDVDPLACRLAERNAKRNGVGGIVVAHQLAWGETGDELDACVRAAAVPSRAADAVDGVSDASSAAASPALLIASDVLYDWTGKSADALERTLRALLGRGGAEQVLLCWRVRTRKEERFLHRLADLGDVSTVWRIGGDAPPLHASDDDVAWDDWTARNMGTFVMGRLRLRVANEVACRCGAAAERRVSKR